jgi:hypothetical protein
MRWIIRSLIFWALCAPLAYVFGLPILLDKLTAKTRADALAQCQQHLQKEGMAGAAGSMLSTAMADEYCACVSGGLSVTRADLMELVQKKPPTALTAAANANSTKCNAALESKLSSPMTPDTAPVNPGEQIMIPIN